MGIPLDDCAGVILAGGQSRRMGRSKALLSLGGQTMVQRLSGRLAGFGELWLSANDPALGEGFPGRTAADRVAGGGPLAGLEAVLSATERPYLFCVACDMPHVTWELASALLEAFPAGADALVCQDSTGRVHPLCGVYARAVLPVLREQLAAGRLRVRDLLERVDCALYQLAGRFPDRTVWNVNTPEAFRRLEETEQ